MVMLRNFNFLQRDSAALLNKIENKIENAMPNKRYGAWGENAGTKLDDFQVHIVYSVV